MSFVSSGKLKLEAVRSSQDLNVHTSHLRNWVKKFSGDPQHAFRHHDQIKLEQLEIVRLQAPSGEAEGGAGHTKSRGLLREGVNVKFSFIAKHRGIWALDWVCEALGVSAWWLHYAWLRRARSQRSRSHEELGAKIRTSFLASHRTSFVI